MSFYLWDSLSSQYCDSSLIISHLSVKGLCTQVTSCAIPYNILDNMSHQKNLLNPHSFSSFNSRDIVWYFKNLLFYVIGLVAKTHISIKWENEASYWLFSLMQINEFPEGVMPNCF